MAQAHRETERDRGRGAARPREIPARGWKEVLLRVKDEISRDKLSIVAAGLAYYGMMAVFPALIALITVYGLVANPADVQQQMQQLGTMVPQDVTSILERQLTSIASGSQAGLSIGLAASLFAALWSASSGTTQLIESINIVYDEEETRGFLKLRGLALLMTFGVVIFVVVALFLLTALPPLVESLGLGQVGQTVINVLRWPLLAAAVMVGLAVLYRYAPDRDRPKWRWVSWGAVAATGLWLLASAGLSLYTSQFAKLNETYGALAGVIVFLLWFFLSGFAVLLGAEIDSELEHQTARDSTVGAEKPMGARGAVKADSLPGGRDEPGAAERRRGPEDRRREEVYYDPSRDRRVGTRDRRNGAPPPGAA